MIFCSSSSSLAFVRQIDGEADCEDRETDIQSDRSIAKQIGFPLYAAQKYISVIWTNVY